MTINVIAQKMPLETINQINHHNAPSAEISISLHSIHMIWSKIISDLFGFPSFSDRYLHQYYRRYKCPFDLYDQDPFQFHHH